MRNTSLLRKGSFPTWQEPLAWAGCLRARAQWGDTALSGYSRPSSSAAAPGSGGSGANSSSDTTSSRNSGTQDSGMNSDFDGLFGRALRSLQHVGGSAAPTGSQYATHSPLNVFQKGAVAVLSGLGALTDPARGDLVAAMGETTGHWAFQRMRSRMQADETGRRILATRPRITNATTAHTWDLPPSTFGGAYAKFMGDRNFQADERPPVRFIDDEELAYVASRAREVHDFWHVLFGCHTNNFGELAIKAVEFVQGKRSHVQTGLPMTGLAVAGAQWRLSASDRAVLTRDFLPWAVRAGTRSADLMCLFYEEHFEDDLEELRLKWRITPAPLPPKGRARKEQWVANTAHAAAP